MSRPVIHYRHPQLSENYHACGMGKPPKERIVDDITKVTCQRCLGTVTGAKASNRQISDRPKIQKAIRIDANLIDRLRVTSARTGLTHIQLIESALDAYLD